MKVKDCIKMIEADGWYLVATRGSHRQYKHPSNLATSGCSCSVPSGTSHRPDHHRRAPGRRSCSGNAEQRSQTGRAERIE
ncbi:type II toxin-antitoxin system HicA family toxin [Methanoculleus horonobensis]|uniref:type II toxin-antitoxin system HicA family toxin n=1 Tax=Methanoculleus horonobensis TaxID=528314 RepID=UPI00373FC7F4